MKCFSGTETPKTMAEPADEKSPTAARRFRTPFAPRKFRGLSADDRGKHSHRLSHILRSIAARTEKNARSRTIATIPPFPTEASDAADRGADAAFQVATTAKSRTSVLPKSAGEDRRRFLRRYSTHLVRVLPVQDVSLTPQELDWSLHHSPFRGQMKNISMNGVAFLLKKPLDISAGVWLRLECQARDFAVIRSAHVTRVIPVSGTEWVITCRFDRCVPYADVAQLGQELC